MPGKGNDLSLGVKRVRQVYLQYLLPAPRVGSQFIAYQHINLLRSNHKLARQGG